MNNVDDVAISEAIAEVEKELEEDEVVDNPSIWEVNLDIGRTEEDDVDTKDLSPDDKAIADAVAQVEKELADEEFRENPSIWDIVGKPSQSSASADYSEDNKNMTVDERAIAEAVAQVEKELEEEQFRENPSIWDLNAEIQDKAGSESSIWEVNLKAIDEDLREISPKRKGGSALASSDNSSPEDDVAIAEAIAQVEKELKKEKTAEISTWYLGLAIVGGLVATKLASAWFTKNA
eukprot:gene21325-27355_t